MLRRRVLTAAAVAAVAILYPGSRADAGFSVSITSAGTNTIVDNGAGDTNPLVGVIQGSASNNFYNIQVTATASQTATSGLVTDQTISIDSVSLGAADIFITTARDDFTFAPVGATVTGTNSISTTLLDSTTTASATSTVDGTTSAMATVTGPTVNDSDVTPISDVIGVNPFAISNTIKISGLSGVGATANVTATTVVNAEPVNPVPAPGGLVLLGTAVPVFGLLRRRLRRKESLAA